jgi:acyl-CoA reductase-like NAD-dependent aldehyde dehydrogenase
MITNEPKTLTRVRWSSDRDDDRFTVHDPASAAPITVVQGGGIPEVHATVRAAHEAFGRWCWLTSAQRARYLLACADVLAEHADELAALESRENGKPVADARAFDLTFVADAGGSYVAPTLFTDVTRDMRIAQAEIFGPVVTVMAFDSEDEAISIANEPEYGLLAAVYSGDMPRALRVSRKIEAGMVLINNYFRGMMGTPFGGTKHSGFGREHAIETMREFTYPKTIRFPSGLGDIPSWRAVHDVNGEASGSVGSEHN